MKKTKKLIGAVGALAMSVALAAGSTFAWFSTNKTVTVGSFDAQVTTGSADLKVAVSSADGEYSMPTGDQFKATLLGSDITAVLNANLKLDALTTTDSGVTLKTKEDTAATTAQYAAFRLTFRSSTPSVNVALAETSTETDVTKKLLGILPSGNTTTGVYAWENIAAGKYGNDTKIDAGGQLTTRAAYAARVAFVVDSASKVWCPNEAKASGAQVELDDSSTGQGNGLGFWKGNLAGDYYNKFVKAETIKAEGYTNYIANWTAGSITANDIIGTTAAATSTGLVDCYDLVVTVKIWLEGTDGDCFNAVLKDSISTKLNFTVWEAPSGS